VVFFVPTFLLPGVVVFVLGYIAGQLYIKAQLSVKREMSNHRSPVLSHFGAAIAGISQSRTFYHYDVCDLSPPFSASIRAYGAQAAFKGKSLERIDGYARPARTFYNCNRYVTVSEIMKLYSTLLIIAGLVLG